MKKIIFSLGTIVLAGAVIIGGTYAFFNDTETSAGNIFTAGSIDLKVDHLAQTYNGDDCESCSLVLFSGDGGADVVSGVNTEITVFPFQAPIVIDTPITLQYWTTHPTAQWIWASPATLVGDDGTDGNVTYTFEHEFDWWGDAVNVDLVMDVAADNQYELFLNGVSISAGSGSAQYTTLDPVSEASFLAQAVPGENTLTFVVTNLTQTNPAYNTPLNNPGGLLYYLTVTRDAEDCDANSEFKKACQLWRETDLDGSQKFFNFGDVKPSDWGTNLISLHVNSNDAYACLIIHDMNDEENELLETEESVGDTPTSGNPAGLGELSDYINIFAWEDDGDGVYEPNTEDSLYEGNIQTEVIQMSLAGGGPTGYVGFAWCDGNIKVNHTTGEINCDGRGMLDDAQSDSLEASLTAYAEQVRNNENFSCENINLDEDEED